MKRAIRVIFASLVALTVSLTSVAGTARKTTTLKKKSARVEAVSQKAKSMAKGAKRTLPDMGGVKTRKSGSNFSTLRRAASVAPRSFMRPALKAPAGVPDIYGSVIFSDNWTDEEQPYGYYKIPTSSAQSFEYLIPEVNATYGGVASDGIYYSTEFFSMFGMSIITGWDLESGEEAYFAFGGVESLAFGLAKDPVSELIYGIFYNEDASGFVFGTVEYAEDEPIVSKISDLPGELWNSFAIDSKGNFYGIRVEYTGEAPTASTLCKIDRTTGAVSEIGLTGLVPVYFSSAAFDLTTDRLYWTVCPADGSGYMAEVDVTTGEATPIYDFPGNEQVVGLYIPKPVNVNVPAALTDLTTDFSAGTLTGKVSFTAPSATLAGDPIADDLDYEIAVNNIVKATGKVAPGKTATADITVDEASTYDITACVANQAGKSAIAKTNVFIGTGVPAAVSDLTVTPGANGALEATVSFVAPDKTYAGDDLATLTGINIYKDGTEIDKIANPAAGEKISKTYQFETEGDITISVVAVNSIGAGIETSAKTYVGTDYPAAPANVTLTETATPGEVTVSWDPVTTDENGNPLNASQVTYAVYEMSTYSRYLIKDGLTDTSLTYQAAESGNQILLQCAVFAYTSRGEGDGDITEATFVGTPYTDYTESFANGSVNHDIGIKVLAGSPQWGLYTDASGIADQNGDNGFIAMQGANIGYQGAITLGKFAISDMKNPGFTFYVYPMAEDDTNSIGVYVKESGKDYVNVFEKAVNEIGASQTWNRAAIDMKDYAGKTFEIMMTGTINAYQLILMDNLRLESLLDNDLAIELQAPATAAPGEKFTLTAKVTNNGLKASPATTVTLKANGKEVASKQCAALESGATAIVEFEHTFSGIDEKDVEFTAEVEYAADENSADNTSSITVTPMLSANPTATDLKAVKSGNDVTLTWTAPDLAEKIITLTETFEDGVAGMTFPGWTFVDVDKSALGGFQGLELPGITAGETLGSFFLFDAAPAQFNETFNAHSGDKYLASLFRYDGGTVDDWAISPKLSGNAQTVTFYARNYSGDYPESIEMYYSTGSSEIADFIKADAVSSVPEEWTEYTVDIPAGANYFAIRSCATDAFMLMVDDVTMEVNKGFSHLTVKGYNIYRNGVKINSELVTDCSYVDAGVPDSDLDYVVTVVYGDGESKGSNVASVASSSGIDGITAGVTIQAADGNIVISGTADSPVIVAATDGKVIYSAPSTSDVEIAVIPGIYVVKAGGKTVKLIVK